jgi:N-acetylglucosamine malate deacetylase 1
VLFGRADAGHLLVVAPHADDEVLGAGGLTLAARAAGWRATVLFMSASGFVSQATGSESSETQRRGEAEAACEVLGARARYYESGNAHHLRFDALPRAELIAFIESEIAESAPTVVAVPSAAHFHQDHQAVAAACEAALRPAPPSLHRHAVPIVLAYGHSGGDWARTGTFRPALFVPIDGHIDRKLDAMACYRSQVPDPPHGRSLDALRAWHRNWGTYAGCTYAEPFEILRFVA